MMESLVGVMAQAGLNATDAKKANAAIGPFYDVPMRNITGRATDYNVKFTWVGDLDGDGEYDHVVLRIPTDELANLPDYVEAYKRDGTLLWAYNAGPNSFNKDNADAIAYFKGLASTKPAS